MMESITPLERGSINRLVYRLGMKEIPSDTNVMAWVLPVLEVVVKRFEDLDKRVEMNERRILELEHALKDMSKK